VSVLKRRSIAIAGVFLIAVGSIFVIFGIWYAWMYGIASDIPIWYYLFPEWAGDLLSLIAGGCSMMVLGTIFILWAHRLSNNQRTS
jgi:hypothetical protein